MRQPTIAELREREVKRLVSFKSDNPTDADYKEAKMLMNSFYRLCGLSEKNLYLSNDERTCNLRSTKISEEKEDHWCKRLDSMFNETYGLNLVYCGYAPSIVSKCDHGGVKEEIQRFFYE